MEVSDIAPRSSHLGDPASAAPQCGITRPQPVDAPIRGDQVSSARDRQPVHFEICVRGRLGRTIRAAFPAFQAQVRGDDTVLAGALPDDAALYGVLAQMEALALEVLELRRLPPDRFLQRRPLIQRRPAAEFRCAGIESRELTVTRGPVR